ncbi:adenosine receptor A3-like [Oculina patagonica]
MEMNFTGSSCRFDKNNASKDFLHRNNSSELDVDVYYKITLCVIDVILSLTAVFGNAAILITIWKTPSLHSAGYMLLASLAISDLAVGLVAIPLFVATLLTQIVLVSVISSIMTTFLCVTSFLTTTAIGVDRLLALQLHLRYKAVVTSFRVTCVITALWVFSSIFAASFSLWIHNEFYLSLTAIFYTLLVGNFAVYSKIYLIVRRHQAQIQQQHQETNNGTIFSVERFKKSAVNTFLVYILLVCCYMPYCFVGTAQMRGASLSKSAYIASVLMALLNSSLNPLLYCWRVREIRTAMKQLFNY